MTLRSEASQIVLRASQFGLVVLTCFNPLLQQNMFINIMIPFELDLVITGGFIHGDTPDTPHPVTGCCWGQIFAQATWLAMDQQLQNTILYGGYTNAKKINAIHFDVFCRRVQAFDHSQTKYLWQEDGDCMGKIAIYKITVSHTKSISHQFP